MFSHHNAKWDGGITTVAYTGLKTPHLHKVMFKKNKLKFQLIFHTQETQHSNLQIQANLSYFYNEICSAYAHVSPRSCAQDIQASYLSNYCGLVITLSKSTFLPCGPIPNQNRGRHAERLLSSLSLSSRYPQT